MKQSFAATRRLTGLDLAELFKEEKSTSIRAMALGQTKGLCSKICFCCDSAERSHLTEQHNTKQRPSDISPKHLRRHEQFCVLNSDAKVVSTYLVSFNTFACY